MPQMTLSDLLTDVDVWLVHDALPLLGVATFAGRRVAYVAIEDLGDEAIWLVAAVDDELITQVRAGRVSARALFDHDDHRWVVASRPDGGLGITPFTAVPDAWLPTEDAFLTGASR